MQPARPHRRFDPALIIGLIALLVMIGGAGYGAYQRVIATPTCPDVISDPYAVFYNVQMLSPDEGWATGYTAGKSSPPAVFHYKDRKWVADSLEQYEAEIIELGNLDFVSSNEAWTVGGSNYLYHYKADKWEQVGPISDTNSMIRAVDMTSADEGWAAAVEGFYHYKNGSWQPVDPGFRPLAYDIQMLSPTEGWSVGNGIFHYSNGKWTEEIVEDDVLLYALSMISSQEGWAVGQTFPTSDREIDDQLIYHYSNGKWQRYAAPLPGNASLQLSNVQMLSGDEGWAIGTVQEDGFNIVLLHYQDGLWKRDAMFKEFVIGHTGISMLSPTEGWAVGGSCAFHYQDGKWQAHQN